MNEGSKSDRTKNIKKKTSLDDGARGEQNGKEKSNRHAGYVKSQGPSLVAGFTVKITGQIGERTRDAIADPVVVSDVAHQGKKVRKRGNKKTKRHGNHTGRGRRPCGGGGKGMS